MLDDRPGYRRRLRIEPGAGRVRALLEDDMHCMTVTLRHDGTHVREVEARTIRAPWTTCPAAVETLARTFVGRPLVQVTARVAKRANCTHLHDLAVLAAAHADDPRPTVYDVAVSDPLAGERSIVLAVDGAVRLRWVERDGVLVSPAALAGLTLQTLRDWIAALPAGEQEAARVLQWAALVAHGRTIPLIDQSDATAMPANCYTFQPERAAHAIRVGRLQDFNDGPRQPLDGVE